MHWEVHYAAGDTVIRHVTIDRANAIAIACRMLRRGQTVHAVAPMRGAGALTAAEIVRLCAEVAHEAGLPFVNASPRDAGPSTGSGGSG